MNEDLRAEHLLRAFDQGSDINPVKNEHYNWQQLAEQHSATNEKRLLEKFYYEQKLSIRDIGSKLSVSPSTVRSRLQKNNILIRKRGGPNNVKGNKNLEKILSMLNENFGEVIEAYGGSMFSASKALEVSLSTLYRFKRKWEDR